MAAQVASPSTMSATHLSPDQRPHAERFITNTNIRPDTIRTISVQPTAFPTFSKPTELVKSMRHDVAVADNRPAIFLVHGAWHTPASYDPLVELLTARGFVTFRAHLPSSIEADDAPTATLYDDAGIVRSQLLRLIERGGKDVVVIAHSYGGVVVGEAVKEEMTKKARAAKGRKGGVVGFFLIAGYLVEKGASLARPEDGLPGWMDQKPDGRTTVPDPISLFYNDVDHQHALQLAYGSVGFSQRPAYTLTTRAAWKYVPLTYCLCRDSVAFPVEAQQAMIELARAAEVDVDVVELAAGHLPQLSVPSRLADEVESWIGRLDKNGA